MWEPRSGSAPVFFCMGAEVDMGEHPCFLLYECKAGHEGVAMIWKNNPMIPLGGSGIFKR